MSRLTNLTWNIPEPPLFVLPAPLTDRRVWCRLIENLPNLVAIDFENIEMLLDTDTPTIEDYAAAFADCVANHPCFVPQSRPVWIGGLCMGGMVAVMAVNELLQRETPPDIAGVVLLSSTVAFAPGLGPILCFIARLLKDLLPYSVSSQLIRVYIKYFGLRKSSHAKRASKRSLTKNGEAEPSFARLYRTMVHSRSPDRVSRRLMAEARFDARLLLRKQNGHFPPIYHLHGKRDRMLRLRKIQKIHASVSGYDRLEYHLRCLPNAGHFLPITHPKETMKFLKQTLNCGSRRGVAK